MSSLTDAIGATTGQRIRNNSTQQGTAQRAIASATRFRRGLGDTACELLTNVASFHLYQSHWLPGSQRPSSPPPDKGILRGGDCSNRPGGRQGQSRSRVELRPCLWGSLRPEGPKARVCGLCVPRVVLSISRPRLAKSFRGRLTSIPNRPQIQTISVGDHPWKNDASSPSMAMKRQPM